MNISKINNTQSIGSYVNTKFNAAVNAKTASEKAETSKAFISSQEDMMKAEADRIREQNETSELDRILNKYVSGQKLTPGELSYLAKHNPEKYKEVAEVMRQREELERQMKNSGSKDRAEIAYAMTVSSLSSSLKSSSAGNGSGTTEVLAKHYNNAYHEFKNSKEYADLPGVSADEKEKDKYAGKKKRENGETYGLPIQSAYAPETAVSFNAIA
jgi:hypothetical protein